MSVLVSSPRPSLPIVLATWLFFVALPAALIWSLWSRGMTWEETQQSEHRRNRLEQEMQAFTRELEPPTFIEARCTNTLRSFWKREFLPGHPLTAGIPIRVTELRHRLERSLTVPVTAVIWHGPDTNECWIDTNSNWDSSLSRRGLLQVMAQANGQIWRRRHSSPPPLWQNQLGRLNEIQKQNLLRGLGRTLFGDIIRAQIQPWQAVPFLSRNFGGGRVFAFYAVFATDESPDSPVLGGCLVLIRERDLDPDRLLAAASQRSLHQGIRRSSRLRSAGQAVASDPSSLPMFLSDRVGERLQARPGEWFLGLLSSRGTFQTHPGVDQRLLEVTLPAQARQNSLRLWLPYLEGFLQISFSLGSLLFINLAWFGFAFPLRLRGKILVGSLLASAFPIGILVLGLGMQQRLQIDRTRETLSRRMQSHQRLLEHLFRSYLVDVGLGLLNRAADLAPVAAEPLTFAASFSQALHGLPIRDVFAVAADRTPFVWSPAGATARDSSAMEQTALLSMARAFHLGVDPDTRNRRPEIKVHGIIMNLGGVGDLLARPGLLLHSDLLAGRDMIVSGIPLPLASGAAVLLVRFRPEDLLEDFFRKHEQHLRGFQEQMGVWSISLAALRLEINRTSRATGWLWEPHPGAGRFLQPYLERGIRLGLSVEQEIRGSDGKTRLITSSVFSRFPCMLVACAETSNQTLSMPVVLGTGLYLLLLLSFVVLLLEQVFRRPILFFAQAAAEIEQGRYPAQPPVVGGDELGRLGLAFGEMVQGLRQRDELSHFVSDEVMNAVQAESDEGLKPGGELMPVTVLFASLRGFRPRMPNLTPAEKLRILNAFLDTSVQVLKMYGGSLDKMLEDTVMGVFRPRPNTTLSSVRAVQAALHLQKALSNIWKQVHLSCDIGIAHGTVLSGRIGSHHGTLDFSVIGNAVNLAARLKAEAKKANVTGILVDPALISHAHGTVRVAFLERASIKGRSRSFNLYEAISIRDDRENQS